jgi:SP family sugar:H+ symporter-like MFS transporter
MVAAVHTKGEGLNSAFDIFRKDYRRAIIFCALVTLAPIAYGYDGTYFTALLETKTFVRQFGTKDADAPDGYRISSSDQSLWVSIIQVGEVVGSLAAGPIG